jgi:hypothetical protein
VIGVAVCIEATPTTLVTSTSSAFFVQVLLKGATRKQPGFPRPCKRELHIAGNLTVDGTKSSTTKLQSGREVALYAVESLENWFEDRRGSCWSQR